MNLTFAPVDFFFVMSANVGHCSEVRKISCRVFVSCVILQICSTRYCCLLCHDVLFFSEPKLQTPNHFLLSVMLNAPLPLWTPTVHVRGKNYRYRIPLVWGARWSNVQRPDSGLDCPGSRPGGEYFVVFTGKTLYSQSASRHPEI